MTGTKNLYLASQSPRRSELLTQIGLSFDILAIDIDEAIKKNESAEDYVIRLANEKAIAGWNLQNSHSKPVLGADTAVVIEDEILGKPRNKDDARRMLQRLSGKSHEVMTAVALAVQSQTMLKPELNHVLSVSKVTFKTLSEQEIEHYVNSGECDDKAGSYAIQGLAAAFISHLSGSYSGVMGLPLYETVELLNKAGIRVDSLVVS